jgi:hypothetical protein
MSYFAQCFPTDGANSSTFTVAQVLSADESFVLALPGLWKQTSYNTYGNVHYAPSPPAEPRTPDGGTPLRANYAGIGYTYDSYHDVFYAHSPYPSWILNTSTWLWEAPVPYPTDGGEYAWDEATLSWVLIPTPPAP